MSKFNVGDKVRYIGKDHKEMSEFYPEIGTVGTVVKESGDTDWYIQWPKGSTSRKDCWYCDKNDVELAENLDMTNEEIWEMLLPKMEKNNVLSEPGVLCQGEDKLNKLLDTGIIDGKYITDVYPAKTVQYVISIAYRSGYERAMKGRPFKIGGNKTGHSEPKKEKTGHWEPVDPNNLPKEGTRVRYSRESKEYTKEPGMINMGDIGVFSYGKALGLPGIRFDDGRFWNWVSFSNEPECLDMWVEDNE